MQSLELLLSIKLRLAGLAQGLPNTTDQCTDHGWLPGLYDRLCQNGTIQINSLANVFVLVINITRILIAVSGALAVILLMVAAVYYITSTGDPARVKRAKDIIINTITGLIIIMLSYVIVTFLAGRFG